MVDEIDVQELVEVNRARSGAYRLLSRLWGGEVDAALWQELRATSFPHVPELPQLDSAYRQLEESLQGEPNGLLADLAADYAALCLGANPQEGADPFESVHRGPERIMMQDEWEQILHFYAQVGLRRSARATEPEDHLALELECMAYLCDLLAEALDAGDGQKAAWVLAQQRVLLDEHLAKWVPSFVSDVIRLAKTGFYRAIASLTQEQLRIDRDLLEQMALPVTAGT